MLDVSSLSVIERDIKKSELIIYIVKKLPNHNNFKHKPDISRRMSQTGNTHPPGKRALRTGAVLLVVLAMAGMVLATGTVAATSVMDDHDHDHDDEIGEFEIIDRSTDEVTAYVHGDHWHGELPHVHEGEHISLGADIEDADGDEIELDGDHYSLGVALAEGAHEGVVSFDEHGDHVHIIGEDDGHTDVVFQLIHDDHVEYETPSIEVEVEHDDHDHDDEIGKFEIVDRSTGDAVADVHGDHWHGSLPHVHEGEHISLGANIEDADGDEIELDGDHYSLGVELADGAHEGVVSFDEHGDHVHIIGDEDGHTDVVFQLWHDDHVEYETPSIEVEVGHAHVGTVELLAEEDIDHSHACLHGDFDERTPLDAGDSADTAPTVSDTHVIWEATYEGDAGHVRFDTNDHSYPGPFVFYTADGSAEPANADVLETGEVDECDSLDEYIEVETPEDGIIDLELEEYHDHDDEIGKFEIVDRSTGDAVADVHGDHWHGSLPHVHEGEHISLGANIEDDHGDEVELDGDHYSLGVELADGAHEGVVSFDEHGDHVHIIGEEDGHTDVVFQLIHDDHVEYETPPIEVEVGHHHDVADDYRNEQGEVDTAGLQDAIADFLQNEISTGDLQEVIAAFLAS